MDWNTAYSKSNPPTFEQTESFIDHPLWREFHNEIQEQYLVSPSMEYSRCSMQPGWNMKYKKSGKSLCTLYPMSGYFIALIVIGAKEMTEAELMVPSCSQYVQAVFNDTPTGMGQKWLMLEVRDNTVFDDIFRLIEIRAKRRK